MSDTAAKKAFPICSAQHYQSIMKGADLNGDGLRDLVYLSPTKTRQVFVSFQKPGNHFTPWLSKFSAADRSTNGITLWGTPLSDFFAAQLSPSLAAQVKAESDLPSGSGVKLDKIHSMHFELAYLSAKNTCELGMRVYASSSNKTVRLFIPLQMQDPYWERLNSNPYVRQLETMERDRRGMQGSDDNKQDMSNPYRSPSTPARSKRPARKSCRTASCEKAKVPNSPYR